MQPDQILKRANAPLQLLLAQTLPLLTILSATTSISKETKFAQLLDLNLRAPNLHLKMQFLKRSNLGLLSASPGTLMPYLRQKLSSTNSRALTLNSKLTPLLSLLSSYEIIHAFRSQTPDD
jgi:hypothetical protein